MAKRKIPTYQKQAETGIRSKTDVSNYIRAFSNWLENDPWETILAGLLEKTKDDPIGRQYVLDYASQIYNGTDFTQAEKKNMKIKKNTKK